MWLLGIVAAICFETSWPEFRGGERDGVVSQSKIPLEWSEDRNIAWRIELPGLGWSSPVIEDGCIFLTTAIPQGKGLSLQVLALSERDGTRLWSREVVALPSAPAIHLKNSHASPTPILKDGFLYAHFGTHGTAKLSQQTGEMVWLCQDLPFVRHTTRRKSKRTMAIAGAGAGSYGGLRSGYGG